MFNSEEDYLDDIATLNARIRALKAENEYLKKEVRKLAGRTEEQQNRTAVPENGERVCGRDGVP
jgi:cell division protein FtsB